MRFRPLTRPLIAPRRARALAALSLMIFIAAILAAGAGAASLQGALTALGVAAAFAVVAVALSVHGLGRLWNQSGIGVGDCALSLFWAIPVLVAAGFLTYMVTQTPAYPDLSTDVNNPPRFTTLDRGPDAPPLPLDAASPAERIRLQLDHPDLAPLYVERPAWHLAEVLDEMIRANGWERRRVETDDGLRFEAEFAVPGRILLTSHDVALRIVDDGLGSLIDARALSNIPLHDFGTNAVVLGDLIEQYFLAVQATPPPASDL
jgi:hypothetical protein